MFTTNPANTPVRQLLNVTITVSLEKKKIFFINKSISGSNQSFLPIDVVIKLVVRAQGDYGARWTKISWVKVTHDKQPKKYLIHRTTRT